MGNGKYILFRLLIETTLKLGIIDWLDGYLRPCHSSFQFWPSTLRILAHGRFLMG